MGAVGALCGIVLRPEEIESVTPGEGMPCTKCIVSHVGGSDPLPPDTAPTPGDGISDDAGPLVAGATYQDWGWPVTLHHDQIRLRLDHDTLALLIPPRWPPTSPASSSNAAAPRPCWPTPTPLSTRSCSRANDSG